MRKKLSGSSQHRRSARDCRPTVLRAAGGNELPYGRDLVTPPGNPLRGNSKHELLPNRR